MQEGHGQERGDGQRQEGQGPEVQEGGDGIRVESAAATAEEAEVKVPSIGELKGLLDETTTILTRANEVDELMEQRQGLVDRFYDIEAIRESRLEKVERFNPLKDIKPNDYERLVAEGVIDEEFAARFESDPEKFVATLQELDRTIAQFESIVSPSADASARLEKLLEMRIVFQGELKDRLDERHEEIAARREETKNNVLEHYSARAKELEGIIAAIESNPDVVARLYAIAEAEMRVFFEKRNAEKRASEEKIEQEKKAALHEAMRAVQSLGARQANAFKRLGEILGNEHVANELLEAFGEEDERKRQSAFDRVRGLMRVAVIDGEGERQLKDPSEVVPWENRATSLPYHETLRELRSLMKNILRPLAEVGDERAQKLLEQAEEIDRWDRVLLELFGRKWTTDHKTNERRLGAFYRNFETRKENDKKGITEERKRAREDAARREAEFKENAKEIIERGGFVVMAPMIEKVRGKNVETGTQKCAVRLEKVGPKKKGGKDMWKIVEMFPLEVPGLWVGKSSPLNMKQFPEWFLKEAEKYFIRIGDDLVERLTYETTKESGS
jgi:hypothetical protein